MLRLLAITSLFLVSTVAWCASLHESEVLLDRCDSPVSMWRGHKDSYFNVYSEWGCYKQEQQQQGVEGDLSFVNDKANGKCMRLDYDFSKGGRYISAQLPTCIPSCASISVWVRRIGSNPVCVQVHDANDQVHAGEFQVDGTGWQKLTVPLTSASLPQHWDGPNDGKMVFPVKRVVVGVWNGKPERGTLFFKNLGVVTSDPSLFYGVSFSTPNPGNVALISKKQTPVSVHVENRLPKPTAVTLRLTAEDWCGRKIPLRDSEMRLPAHGRGTRTIMLDASVPHYYVITADVLRQEKQAATDWTGVAVVRKPRNFGVDDPSCFFGFNTSFRNWRGVTGPIDRDGSMLVSDDDTARLERLGSKWVRIWFPTECAWWWGEPRQGQYRFPDLSAYRHNHQLLMYVLHPVPPTWAINSFRTAGEPLPGKGTPNDDGIFWESPGWEGRNELWSKYCEEAARRLGPFVESFDIANEPDLCCVQGSGLTNQQGIERYKKILHAGAAGVRRGYPGALVAGVSVCGGDFDSQSSFADQVMLSEANSFDVFSGHPYSGVRFFGKGKEPLGPVQNDDAGKCRASVALARRHSDNARFWIGEKGWVLDKATGPLSVYCRDFTRCLAQSLVVCHSVPGVERYGLFDDEGCYESGSEYGIFRDGKPLPVTAAYSTVAYMLYHAEPFRTVDLDVPLQAHCFMSKELNDGTLVIWSTEDKSIVTMRRMPVSWIAYDMLGSKIASGAKGASLRLAVDSSPIYIRFKPIGACASICDSVARASVRPERPVKIEMAAITDLSRLSVWVKNISTETVDCRLSVECSSRNLKLARNQESAIDLPLKKDPARHSGETVSLAVKSAGASYTHDVLVDLSPCTRVESPMLIGDLTMWEHLPPIRVDRHLDVLPADLNVDWNGPEDLSVTAWLGWDTTNLYLAAKVRDDIYSVDDSKDYWENDSLIISIDPMNDAEKGAGYDANDHELGLVLHSNGPVVCESYRGDRQAQSQVKILRVANDTVYEIAITWASLGVQPALGKVFGLNFAAIDNDGRGRQCWMGAKPGSFESKRPFVYKDFYLSGN